MNKVEFQLLYHALMPMVARVFRWSLFGFAVAGSAHHFYSWRLPRPTLSIDTVPELLLETTLDEHQIGLFDNGHLIRLPVLLTDDAKHQVADRMHIRLSYSFKLSFRPPLHVTDFWGTILWRFASDVYQKQGHMFTFQNVTRIDDILVLTYDIHRVQLRKTDETTCGVFCYTVDQSDFPSSVECYIPRARVTRVKKI